VSGVANDALVPLPNVGPWSSLKRGREGEPPAVPIFSIKFDCRVGYRTDQTVLRVDASGCKRPTLVSPQAPRSAVRRRDRRTHGRRSLLLLWVSKPYRWHGIA